MIIINKKNIVNNIISVTFMTHPYLINYPLCKIESYPDADC